MKQELLRIADRTVQTTLADLPEDLREKAMHCRIELLVHAESPADSGLLGLFTGASLADPPDANANSLPKISLFLDTLWDYCDGDRKEFCTEVRITLLHELGHYFGFNEDDLERRGL